MGIKPSAIHNVAIVIPAYNEALRIIPTLKQLKNFLAMHVQNYEVILVDDGSQDNTVAVIQAGIANWPEAKVLTLKLNQGKGAAVRAGVLAASKQNLMFMDADCSTDLAMLERLFLALSPEKPIVIGSRGVSGVEIVKHQAPWREYPAKLLNLWIQAWLLPGVWDTQCGFKVFKTEVAKTLFEPLEELRFGFDIEILYRAKRMGYPIVEVPVRWTNVLNSRVNPVRDGTSMALQVIKLRLKKW